MMRKSPKNEGLKTSRPYHYTRNAQVPNPDSLSQRFVPENYRNPTSHYGPRRLPQYHRALQFGNRRTRNQPNQFRVGQSSGRIVRPYSAGKRGKQRPGKSPKQKISRSMQLRGDLEQPGSSQEDEQKVVQESNEENEEIIVEVADEGLSTAAKVIPEYSVVLHDVCSIGDTVLTTEVTEEQLPEVVTEKEIVSLLGEPQFLENTSSKSLNEDAKEHDDCNQEPEVSCTDDVVVEDGTNTSTDVSQEEPVTVSQISAKELPVLYVSLPQLNIKDLKEMTNVKDLKEMINVKDLKEMKNDKDLKEMTNDKPEKEVAVIWSNSSSESFQSISPVSKSSKETEILEKPHSSSVASEENGTEVVSSQHEHSFAKSIRSISSRRPLRTPVSPLVLKSHSRASFPLTNTVNNTLEDGDASVTGNLGKSSLLGLSSHNNEHSLGNVDISEVSGETSLSKKRKVRTSDDHQEYKKQRSDHFQKDELSQKSDMLSKMSSPLQLFEKKEYTQTSSTSFRMADRFEEKVKGEKENKSAVMKGGMNDVSGKEQSPITAENEIPSYRRWCSIM